MVFILQIKFCFFIGGSIFLIKLVRNLSLTDIDFCEPVAIHGFHWNFNLCLLIFLKETKLAIVFFFCLGLLSRRFTIHRTTGEKEAIYLSPVYHFHPLHRHLVHRHLDISQEITAEGSPLLIASSWTRIWNSRIFGFWAQVANC